MKQLKQIQVQMFDEKYASPAQLLDLAKRKCFDEMLYLLENFTYCRYAISVHYKSLVTGDMPREVRDKLYDYYESARATL